MALTILNRAPLNWVRGISRSLSRDADAAMQLDDS